MKCDCSLTNEYEIEGLCDIQKFNEKISSFMDESWTQVSISDNLILSGDKPIIKTITKISIDVKITSTKIINTPKSDDPNVAEMKLTGKLLLVAGEILQRVLYVSNNINVDKINSFKINTPFTTYIVLDEDMEVNEDKYCVFSCVEYASLRPINDKSLSQNITMFLFAKIVSKPFNNDIVFKNDNNQELAKIKFDSNTNMLDVTSTKASNDNKILKFELYQRGGTTLRKESTISVNANAEKFAQDLNKQIFNFGDIINISYKDKQNKVLIKNFPNMGEEYNPKIDRNEAFIITRKGLVPYALPNKIILNDENNQKIVELSFSKFGNKVRIISTGNTAPNRFARKDYFKVTLNNTMTKGNVIGVIVGNENGNRFKNRLDDKQYSIGDTIDIFCEEGNKLEITNYPDKDDNYNLKQKTERFKITAKGLEKIDIPAYPNEIILKNTTSQELARVKFNVITSVLEVSSTGNRASVNDDFTVKLIKASSRDEFQGIITANQDATQFKTILNGKAYSIGDVVQINADPSDKAEITNYPDKGNIYNLTQDLERFRITEIGLVKIPIIARYTNTIKLKNQRNQELATILFDTITNVLRVNPQQANQNDDTTIRVELYEEDGRTLNTFGEILGNTGTTQFVESLEGVFFKYGDVINIIYNSKPNKIEIEDYPIQRQQYNPKLDNNEAFVISQNGLKPYVLKDSIISTDGNNTSILEVYFSKLDNKLKVLSTRNNAPNKQVGSPYTNYFSLILFRDNQTLLTGNVPYSRDASSFKQELELQSYSIGDTLMIINARSFSTKIEEVISGRGIMINKNIARYEITENGLQEIPSAYPNDIIFKNDSNQEIAKIRFVLSTQKLFVKRTNNIIRQGTGRPALQFRIYSPDRTLKGNGVIVERALAVSFVDDLNEKSFNFGDIIVIGYGNYQRRVNVINFQAMGQTYTPIFTVSEAFIVTQTGLVRYILQNTIMLTDLSNNTIALVVFYKFSKELKIIVNANIAPSKFVGKDYFKITLNKKSGGKEVGVIQGNETGANFKASLDSKKYVEGDVLEIFCEEPNNVVITSYPNLGDSYRLTQKTESFMIDLDKLEK